MALHLATLQLEKWSLNEADSAGAAAGADVDGPSSPAEAAAAASLGALHSGDSAAGDTPVAAKRKRTGRSGAVAPPAAAAAAPVANGRGSAGGDDAAGGAGKPGGRGGLRHFSMKVCEKVESKGDTTYEQVANELIAEMKAEVAAGGPACCRGSCAARLAAGPWFGPRTLIMLDKGDSCCQPSGSFLSIC